MNNIEIFTKYVKNFDWQEEAIVLKYNHSLRVMSLCEKIAKHLGLHSELIKIASFVGLTHDLGRFTQWTDYHTFKDADSLDHAKLACDILFENNFINNFNINKEYYDVIKEAIFYHNKFNIGKEVKNDALTIAKIIRDADKIDILYLCSTNHIINEDSHLSINSKVKDDFFHNKLVYYEDIQNDNDRIISKLSFIYDINYNISFNILKNENIIENIHNILNNKELFNPYFKHIDDYLLSINQEL